jgi:DNA polymerase-3 subunit chi
MPERAPLQVAFHTGVADKLGYACRLLRKASRQHARVVVTAPPALLGRLDQALWTFDPQAFVPHVRLRAGQAVSPRLARTPVWLLEAGAEPPHRDLLLNLGTEPAPDMVQYGRVIEVVDSSEEDRRHGQRRWRAYGAEGYTLTHHKQEGQA